MILGALRIRGRGWSNFSESHGYWRDVASYPAMKERLDPYLAKQSVSPDSYAYTQAFERVRTLLSEHYGKVEALKVSEAYAKLPKSTSAGFPFK